MKFSFTATIYKVGINPCIEVPMEITGKMKMGKGYIPVKGKINNHPFTQTLVPVKNNCYRLYVNGPMLQGANAVEGDELNFIIEQDLNPIHASQIPMPAALKTALSKNKLIAKFNALTPYRRKEILRYLIHLKTEEALERNIKKVVLQLKKKLP